MAAVSLGAYIPSSGAITGVAPTLNNPPASGGVGSVTLTVTGFFTFRVYYLFTDTITFTGTIVLTPAPSGDASQPSRILSVTTGGSTVPSTSTTAPSPHACHSGMVPRTHRARGGVASLQPKIEGAINDLLDGLVAPGLASLGFLRSPTSVLSARNVTITSSGMALSLVLVDLFGTGHHPNPWEPPRGGLPRSAGRHSARHTATVTNTATGTPINQANVTLHNFTANGTPQQVGPLQTNTTGEVPFNVSLHPNITYQVIPETHERVRVLFTSPTLTVSKAGFTTLNIRLLEDTSDILSSTASRAVTPWPILVSSPLALRLALQQPLVTLSPRPTGWASWWAGVAHYRQAAALAVPHAAWRRIDSGRRPTGDAVITGWRLILYGADSPSQSWRPRWHRGSLSNSKMTLMEAQQTRRCGSGSAAQNTRSTSVGRMPASSAGKIAPYIEHARKAGRGQGRRATRTASSRERSGDIRGWAKDHGIAVSERGRIPASVVEQYEAATTGV